MKRKDVYKAIDSERDYQDVLWGGPEHDKQHEVGSWLIYIQHNLSRAISALSTQDNADGTLDYIRKITALGVACCEVHGVKNRINE